MRPSHTRRPTEVIYQVYPSSFYDSNGDGCGDLAGITRKLWYIKSLHVDAIWISPFYLSPPGPEGDGGYAVTDYREIDPRFGTVADFEMLLLSAHTYNLRVYIDFVIAHTSSDHVWFHKSRMREEAYSDYYVWSDGASWNDARVPPNNWKSVFGGSAWEFDEDRQQYYLHHFLKSQPALNLNDAHVQAAVLEELKFWLDVGVDGFRFDAIPFATCDEQLRNNPWLYGTWPNVREDWDQQRFDYSICQPQTVDLIARIRGLMDSYPDKKTTLGEVTCGPEGGGDCLPVASSYIDSDKGFDMCYTYVGNFVGPQTEVLGLKDLIRRLEVFFPDGGHCLSIGNHDSQRTFERVEACVSIARREDAWRQLMQLFFCMPGSVILYQGEELGLPQAKIPEDISHDRVKDPVGVCRDGSRTPMPWNRARKNAGFSESDDPYLPVPLSHYSKAMDVQEREPGSDLHFMRSLLLWRKKQPALIFGETIVLESENPFILAFLRRNEDQTLLCVFNLGGEELSLKFSEIMNVELMDLLSPGRDGVVQVQRHGSFFVGSYRDDLIVKG